MFHENLVKNQPVSALERFIIILMHKYNIHTAGYALIDDFEIIGAKSFCEKSMLNDSSLFQACSFSKSITAYAILYLASKNLIQLDQPVNQYLTSWKIRGSSYSDQITVRHCLNMTAGLCFGDLKSTFSGYSQQVKMPVLKEILDGIPPATNSPVQAIFPPGSQYYYSGAGYMVLQQLIEDIVNLPYVIYMDSIILPALGMHNSTFECPLSQERHSLAIPGFTDSGMPLEGGWYNIANSASGGLWSCPLDVANFMIQISSLSSRKSNEVHNIFEEMFVRKINTDYGLGVVVDGDDDFFNFRKNGHNSGYHNEFIMFPHCGKGIAIMTNSASGISLINELIFYAGEKFHWPAYKQDFNEVAAMTARK